MSTLLFISIIYFSYLSLIVVPVKSDLKLVQVVVRHGDRNPNRLYRGMPAESSNWKEGLGQLNREGKQHMFSRGVAVKNKYKENNFLTNDPLEVYIRSSSEQRCLESSAYFLAGAYKPHDEWIWSETGDMGELARRWQAFSINTVPKHEDNLLYAYVKCPKVDEEYEKIMSSQNATDFMKEHQEMFKTISERIGTNISNWWEADEVADALIISYNKTRQPEWVGDMLDKLHGVRRMANYIFFSSREVQRLRVGKLLRELTDNMHKAINNTIDGKKLMIYMTHDTILSALLQGIGVYDHQVPPYGAVFVLELHQDGSEHFVRMYYYPLNNENNSEELVKKTCRNEHGRCVLSNFVDLVKDLFYDDYETECYLTDQLSKRRSNIWSGVIGCAVGLFVGIVGILVGQHLKNKLDKKNFQVQTAKYYNNEGATVTQTP